MPAPAKVLEESQVATATTPPGRYDSTPPPGALRRQSLAGRVGLTILTPSGEPMAGTTSDSLARVARCRQPYRPMTAPRRRDGSPRKPITTERAASHFLTRGGGFPAPGWIRWAPCECPGEGTGRKARRWGKGDCRGSGPELCGDWERSRAWMRAPGRVGAPLPKGEGGEGPEETMVLGLGWGLFLAL